MKQIQKKFLLKGQNIFIKQYNEFRNEMLRQTAGYVYGNAYKIHFVESIKNCLENTAFVPYEEADETAVKMLRAFSNGTINLEILYSEFLKMECATVDTLDSVLDFFREVLI